MYVWVVCIVVIYKLCIKDITINYTSNFKKFEWTPISSATVHTLTTKLYFYYFKEY